MAGNLASKEQAIVTLTTTGASLTNLSANSAATTLDCRSAGNAADMLQAQFQLTCQWATITGITFGIDVADLYLVPALDGTNYPDVDTTAGASHPPTGAFKASFIDAKAPTANTAMTFVTPVVDLFPALYTAYIHNQSGQTMSANWTLKVVAAQAQYT